MTIAFWNINNNTDLGDVLVDFVKENDVDILLLAESEKSKKNKRGTTVDDILLDFISKSKIILTSTYNIIPNDDFRVKVISRLSSTAFQLKNNLFKSSRWSAFFIDIPGIIKFNLFPVHFYSKVNWSDTSLALECVNFARDISIVEQETKCFNSILIGDFNMNPFEHGMVASNGIHGLQDLEYLTIEKDGREIDGTFYKYFYNPMWNFLGDETVPFGTMYFRTSGHVSQEWNIFDQVLLRPELKDHITKKSTKIITIIAGKPILKKYNRPDEKYSDHLPITITLTI
ncbi:hypothetical protein [Pedobacter psychrodurus]|uniref:hypothetical protein n=1 Tax=Pedobacter psychrodurus TaxID=2530456 RepID=UPI00292E3CFF|nr:hypothetical protein [Pedobacter psychrodurus]